MQEAEQELLCGIAGLNIAASYKNKLFQSYKTK
jgi:hypothetical protein